MTPRRRTWPRRLAVGVATPIVLVLAVYSWALVSVEESSIARAMVWMEADVGDQYRFPARIIPAGDVPSALAPAPAPSVPTLPDGVAAAGTSFDDFLRRTSTRGFLVVHADRVVYERYLAPSSREARETSFSIAKSFLSTLIGIAIDRGEIGDVEDSVTRYIPELADRDPRFERITLGHLLSMSSGLRYVEQAVPVFPWGDDIDTYYGTDLRDLALNATEIQGPPGEVWLYNNYNPLLLGMVLERATGRSVSQYMSTVLWRPLGAERDASWSLDSRASGFEKMESGFNAAAADYARFGLMFLHGGAWNGTRIVSEDWVRAATSDQAASPANDYGYYWWIDTERSGRFYGLGNFGQYLYVAPDTETVVVRLGAEWGVDNHTWLSILRHVADRFGAGGS